MQKEWRNSPHSPGGGHPTNKKKLVFEAKGDANTSVCNFSQGIVLYIKGEFLNTIRFFCFPSLTFLRFWKFQKKMKNLRLASIKSMIQNCFVRSTGWIKSSLLNDCSGDYVELGLRGQSHANRLTLHRQYKLSEFVLIFVALESSALVLGQRIRK